MIFLYTIIVFAAVLGIHLALNPDDPLIATPLEQTVAKNLDKPQN